MAVVEELIGRISFQTKGINQAKAATKTLADLRKSLRGLANAGRMKLDGPARMAKGFKDAQREAAKLAAEQRKLGAGGGGRGDAGLKRQVTLMQDLRKITRETAKEQALLRKGPVGGSWIKAELGHLARYKAELRAVTREAGRMGVPRHRAERMARVRYGRESYGDRHPIGEAIGGGVLAGGVGRGSRYAVAQGANALQEGNRQRNAGMEAGQIAELDKRALDLSTQFPSVDSTKIRNLGAGARNMMPDFSKAMEILPDLVKAQVMLQAIKGVDAADKELDDFLKGADNFGKTEDVASLRNLLNGAIKAKAVEGGQFSLSDFKAVSKTSKAAGASLSNEFLTEIMPTFAQSEGGSRFGTQVSAGAASLVSNRRTKKSTAALGSYGLLEKNGDTKGVSLLQTNPYEWAIKYLMPALQKKGVDINSDQAVSKAIAGIFSSSVSENEFTKFITQREQAERNKKTYRGAKGTDAAKDQLRGDPYVGLEGLIAQIRNFFAVTQSENVAGATRGLASITEAIGDFTKKLSQDPETAQKVGLGAAAGAGALGGWGILKFFSGAKKVLGLGGKEAAGEGLKVSPAESAAEGIKAGPQMSAMDVAARTAARASAAVAIPVTLSQTKGERRALMERIGTKLLAQDDSERERRRGAAMLSRDSKSPVRSAEEEREFRRGRAMAEFQRGAPHGKGAGKFGEMTFDSTAVKDRLAEMRKPIEEIAQQLQFEGKLTLDTSPLDAMMAKIKQAKAELAGLGGGGGLGKGAGGASLTKGSNSFTSPGATAP